MLEIIQIPALKDNYIYLLHESETNETAAVDPSLAEPVLLALKQRGWKLNWILNTHPHADHVGGNLVLKAETDCRIVGASADKLTLPGLDFGVHGNTSVQLGNTAITVLSTPGHTSHHLAYYVASDAALFCGDTLFAMGCGRVFDGTVEQLWHSLQQLRALPPATRIYSAHEYTETNARFALSLEPNHPLLLKKQAWITERRAKGLATVPTTLADELITNPFLRTDDPNLQHSLGLFGQSSLSTFKTVRHLKDQFK